MPIAREILNMLDLGRKPSQFHGPFSKLVIEAGATKGIFNGGGGEGGGVVLRWSLTKRFLFALIPALRL